MTIPLALGVEPAWRISSLFFLSLSGYHLGGDWRLSSSSSSADFVESIETKVRAEPHYILITV